MISTTFSSTGEFTGFLVAINIYFLRSGKPPCLTQVERENVQHLRWVGEFNVTFDVSFVMLLLICIRY